MKWEKPILIDLTDSLAYGACTGGSNPSGGGCASGTAAANECGGGGTARLGCRGGGNTVGPACRIGIGPDTCRGGKNG